MAEVLRWVLVNADDEEGDYEYSAYRFAEQDAARLGCAVIQRTYTYDDSELVWTPDGSDQWPPGAEPPHYIK